MNIEHISVSRAETFHQCNFLYKLKYHLKLPIPGPEKPWFSFGKTVHKICEEYVKSQAQTPINEITKEILSGKMPIEERDGHQVFATHLSDSYKDSLPGILRAVEKITKILGTSGSTEFVFEYDLDPPNKKILTGVIDRLIEKGDKYWILDYKTTKKGIWRKTPQTIIKDVQLRCYARFVQKKFNASPQNIQAGLFYLLGGDLIGARFSEQSLIDVECYLLQTYDSIKGMEPEEVKGRVGDHCRLCDYKTMCQFYGNHQKWRR